MLRKIRNRHFFILDTLLIIISVYISFVLRLERIDIAPFWMGGAVFTMAALAIMLTVFRGMGVYSRYWQYASVDEMLLLVGAVTVGTLLAGASTFLLLFMLPNEWVLPRSIPLIFLLIALIVMAGPRLTLRTLTLHSRRGRMIHPAMRVLIMGAGEAGNMMVREMVKNPQLGLLPIGFLDDDPRKHGVRIHGIEVLGGRGDIFHLAKKHDIQQVIIALPSAPGKEVREITGICEAAGVTAKIIPGMYELLGGMVNIKQLRDVDIEDLLRREVVYTDTTAVTTMLSGKRVLITGGGGSIGSELCRQVLHCQPEEIILLGHGENSIFMIYHELKRLNGSVKFTPVLADIRFSDRVQHLFKKYRPEVVFHAAAHKHVPLMEKNPSEAVTNNILGTKNLLAAAISVDVQNFILISTDKAVNPTSIMGATKRTAEMLVHQASRKAGKPYAAVRFGNVLGSRGSVVLTFKEQIAAGGPVTVTHPEMERFFMTIPEAVQLVMQAATLARGGEVFLLDMGEPVKIVDLARDLISLSGLEEGRDIDIVYTGIRPGEKLFEELFIPGERYQETPHNKIFTAVNASRLDVQNIEEDVGMIILAAEKEDHLGIIRGLQRLIPEYKGVETAVQQAARQEQGMQQKIILNPIN